MVVVGKSGSVGAESDSPCPIWGKVMPGAAVTPMGGGGTLLGIESPMSCGRLNVRSATRLREGGPSSSSAMIPCSVTGVFQPCGANGTWGIEAREEVCPPPEDSELRSEFPVVV